MFETRLPGPNQRSANAYADLKNIQKAVGSQERVKIGADELGRRSIVAQIDDISEQTVRGTDTVIGNGKSAAEALKSLRDQILDIGAQSSGRTLVLGPRGYAHTKIVFTPSPE